MTQKIEEYNDLIAQQESKQEDRGTSNPKNMQRTPTPKQGISRYQQIQKKIMKTTSGYLETRGDGKT